MPGDLHSHSNASSDSTLSLKARVQLAIDHDLSSIAITDHTAIHERLHDRESVLNGVTVIAGVELNCIVDGDRIDILGLFVDPDILRKSVGSVTYGEGLTVADGSDLSPEDVIAIIHEAGGVAVLAHPGRYQVDLAELLHKLGDSGLDGIETKYAYELAPVCGPYTPEARIASLAAAFELVPAGGSDCHGPGYHDGPFMGAIRIPDSWIETLRSRSRQYQ